MGSELLRPAMLTACEHLREEAHPQRPGRAGRDVNTSTIEVAHLLFGTRPITAPSRFAARHLSRWCLFSTSGARIARAMIEVPACAAASARVMPVAAVSRFDSRPGPIRLHEAVRLRCIVVVDSII